MNRDAIHVVGASQHNLKHLTLDIPLNRITVVTGVSGSGKSSLAFDTLYAEGQRRYIETFSPYARQFMDRMDRPHVERIEGIPPAIAIDSKDPVRTSRSTVGTMTEVTDYVKLLYARYGRLRCRSCGRPVAPESPSDVWRSLADLPGGAPLVITFPSTADGSTTGRATPLPGPGGLRPGLPGGADPRTRGGRGGGHRVGGGRGPPRLPRRRPQARARLPRAGLPLRGRPRRRLDRRRRAPRVQPPPGVRLLPGRVRFPAAEPVFVQQPGRRLRQLPRVRPRHRHRHGPDRPRPRPLARRRRRQTLRRRDGRQARVRGTSRPAAGAKHPHGPALPGARPRSSAAAIVRGHGSSYYGIEGYFRWLEGRTYRMHVRVFLSRYRSYDVCPACSGDPLQGGGAALHARRPDHRRSSTR